MAQSLVEEIQETVLTNRVISVFRTCRMDSFSRVRYVDLL